MSGIDQTRSSDDCTQHSLDFEGIVQINNGTVKVGAHEPRPARWRSGRDKKIPDSTEKSGPLAPIPIAKVLTDCGGDGDDMPFPPTGCAGWDNAFNWEAKELLRQETILWRRASGSSWGEFAGLASERRWNSATGKRASPSRQAVGPQSNYRLSRRGKVTLATRIKCREYPGHVLPKVRSHAVLIFDHSSRGPPDHAAALSLGKNVPS